MEKETAAGLMARAQRYRRLAALVDDAAAARSCLSLAEECEAEMQRPVASEMKQVLTPKG